MDRLHIWDSVTQNLPIKLVSVLIATILWVVVLGSRDVEVSKEVPVEVLTSPEFTVASEIPDKVSFRLSGPKAFLRAVLDRREDPIQINLIGAKPGLITHRIFSDNIRLPIGVKVLSLSPASFILKLEAIKTKTVPIKVVTRGELPEGLRLKALSAIPENIRVSGPESRLDSITEIETAPLDLGTINGSVNKELSLDSVGKSAHQGLRLSESLVRAQVTIDGVGANFKINNVSIKVTSSFRAKLQTPSVTAMVRASPGDLRKLDRSRIYGLINLQGKPKGSYTEPVQVVLPPNITLVRVVPETVSLTLY